MTATGTDLPIFLFEPASDPKCFADPSLNAGPSTASLPGNLSNAASLFIHRQNIHQHTHRGSDNGQKSMGQDREGLSETAVIITPVSLDIYQFIVKQIPAVMSPFCIAVTVAAVWTLDDGRAVFSCDF